MLKSMTGFGQSELNSPRGPIRIEIKSTNHKFLEISTRLPNHLAELEETTRKRISEKVRRGKLLVFVSSADPSTRAKRLELNVPLAKEVLKKVRLAQTTLGLKNASDDAVLREVLRFPDVLVKEMSSSAGASAGKDLLKALDLALASLDKSRQREGAALEKDFRNRIAEIRKALGGIEKRIPIGEKEYRKSLETRVKDFLPAEGGSAFGGKGNLIDRERLTQDVAQFVRGSDVSEEVIRLKSHLDGLAGALSEKGELGRKIDFMGQEMTREANTIGSKSSDVEIAASVIDIKGAIEKIREQSQNIE